MKIPKNVRIAGIDYEIITIDNPFETKLPNVSGEICYTEQEIHLVTCLKPDKVKETLLHELVHGVVTHYNLEFEEEGQEEKVVEIISAGLYQVLKDNPEVLECLKK